MRRKIFDNMQVVYIWCICCILNIIRSTVKSISSLLHVSSTAGVNEAKMKRTKIFRFEVWDESVRQHLIGDKSIRQAEKNPSGNIWQIHVASWKVWRRRIGGGKFCHKIATKLPRSPAFSLGLIQASVKHLDFTDNAATRCMWKQVKHLDSDDSGD